MFCFNRSFYGVAVNWQECCHQLSLRPWHVSHSFVFLSDLLYICDNETCIYTVNKTESQLHFEKAKRVMVVYNRINSEPIQIQPILKVSGLKGRH